MLGPGIFALATVTSIVTSGIALRAAPDRGFVWIAAAFTALETLLLAFVLVDAASNLL